MGASMNKSIILVRNQKGFSLIELMVVVAIIGILGGVGVPMYTKFKQKAYSAEAKTSLGALYVAQHAFFLEYGAYHSSFSIIGFVPSARSRYNVGFGSVGTVADASNNFGAVLSAQQQSSISTKSVCTGFGSGTSTECTLVVAAPDIPSQVTVYGDVFVAGAIANEIVAKEETNIYTGSPIINFAAMILFPTSANAVMVTPTIGIVDPVSLAPPRIIGYSFNTEDSIAGDSWTIDNTKTFRHSMPGAAGDTTENHYDVMPPTPPGVGAAAL
jgi:type IV pilus assembly protein PilA